MNKDATTNSGPPETANDIPADCSKGTDIERTVCAATALLNTLSSDEREKVALPYTDRTNRTKWSNLPPKMRARAGAEMSALSPRSQEATLTLMKLVLSQSGNADLNGVRAADEYLGTLDSNVLYNAGNYSIAIFGTPSTTSDWAIMFGGHHMAYNISYVGGVAYPTPNHIGVEPTESFTIGGSSYAPLRDEGEAMKALFVSLSPTELAKAYLSGQVFMDVLIGPVEYKTGASDAAKAKYPKGSQRTGVLVSSLNAAGQAHVTRAIAAWVNDFNPAISDKLIAEYTSPTAYGDTYIAFGGPSATSVDLEQSGTYLRIDGPRLWLELSCQPGAVILNKTHYHTIYRDKEFDYGGSL